MRLGLLAAARITTQAIIDPASAVEGVDVVAVAARDQGRADEAAERWDLDLAFGSYEALLESDEIDAIYIATPAALHHRWTIAALAAGKHVLCEKPFANNATEASEMVAAGRDALADRGLILMEAFHWRYHPFVAQMQAVLDSGELGPIRHVEAHFNLPEQEIPKTDIRWNFAIGGGALMDLGCYPIQWVRWVAGAEPEVMSAEAECPVEHVDGRLTANLRWPSGVTGTIECSMIGPGDRPRIDLIVNGDDATMTAINPLAPQNGASLRVSSPAGTVTNDVDASSTYLHQLVAFRDAVANGVMPITSGDDAVQNMATIDACYIAAGLPVRGS